MSLSLILSRLRELRLGAMAQALERQLEQPGTYDDLSFTERMGLLVERECLEREGRRQQRLVREAHFRLRASLSDIDYSHPRNLKKSQIAQLGEGDWVDFLPFIKQNLYTYSGFVFFKETSSSFEFLHQAASA